MTKKKELNYTELDIILQANSIVMKDIKDLAVQIHEKYEGGMAMDVAHAAAKDYYIFGLLPMKLNPELRKQAEKEVKQYHKERDERLKKLNSKKGNE